MIDPKLVPAAAALDPLLTTGMPKSITAATGMDALTHAVEAYTNRWPHAETAFHAVSAVRMIFANLPRACANGEDLEAREAMLLASFYAGLAFTKAYVGYVHAFSHKVGGMYGVPHGLGNAILLPYVLDFLKDAPLAEQRLAELAVAIGAGTAGEPRAVLAQRFIERVRELNRTVGIPEKLEALKAADMPAVARAAMIEAHRDYPVPKNMSLAEAEALLQRCLNKWRIEIKEGANNDGVARFRVTPKGEAAIEVTVTIKDGRSENGVASDVKNAFKAALDAKRFHVEGDDGEDVLVKKKGGPDFSIELIESTLKGTHFDVERE